jgi:hypothetical protein
MVGDINSAIKYIEIILKNVIIAAWKKLMHENFQQKSSNKYATNQFDSENVEKPTRRYQRLPVFIKTLLPDGVKFISAKVSRQFKSRKEAGVQVVVEP